MTRPAIVIVSGSRDYIDVSRVRLVLSAYSPGTILLHGDCGHLGWSGNRRAIIGADWIARDLASPLELVTWPLAYFEVGGREARNESMVAIGAALSKLGHGVEWHAFPLEKSIGTWKFVRLAKAAALPGTVHE